MRLYNLRIRCTQLAALTVEHLRQATWAKVDELANIFSHLGRLQSSSSATAAGVISTNAN